MVGGARKDGEKVPSFLSEGTHPLHRASPSPEQGDVKEKSLQLVSGKGFLAAELTLNLWSTLGIYDTAVVVTVKSYKELQLIPCLCKCPAQRSLFCPSVVSACGPEAFEAL